MDIIKQIEIDSNDFQDDELFQELERKIECKFILHTEEYQKKMKPDMDAQIQKLTEIRKWLLGY